MFLTDNIKMDKIPTKIYPPFTLYFSFEGNSCIKICKMSHQIFYFLLCFILVLTSFSRHHFLQILRTSVHSTLCARKIFVTNFSSLTDPLKLLPPQPPNSQNPLSMTKDFCRCSLDIVMEPEKSKRSFQRPFSLHY